MIASPFTGTTFVFVLGIGFLVALAYYQQHAGIKRPVTPIAPRIPQVPAPDIPYPEPSYKGPVQRQRSRRG